MVIDAAFWASLRREEGITPRISLALLSPGQTRNPLRFERALPLTPQTLTKLAPAAERPGIHLGVHQCSDALAVWGATRRLPPSCFVLEVIAPGLLVIKQSGEQHGGKFINLAVLQGDELKIVDQRTVAHPDCPAMVTSLLGFESRYASAETSNVLVQLAVSMRAHGHGGLLLLVPAGSATWRDSIAKPVPYSVDPPFAALTELMRKDPAARPRRRWRDALIHAIDAIAGLTAIDGAAVLSDDYSVLAFGAKIIRRQGWKPIQKLILSEPIEGSAVETVTPARLGGTRHLSAAQFAQDQPDALALVASQDGRFTVFAWSPQENSVRAHRIESLLL